MQFVFTLCVWLSSNKIMTFKEHNLVLTVFPHSFGLLLLILKPTVSKKYLSIKTTENSMTQEYVETRDTYLIQGTTISIHPVCHKLYVFRVRVGSA